MGELTWWYLAGVAAGFALGCCVPGIVAMWRERASQRHAAEAAAQARRAAYLRRVATRKARRAAMGAAEAAKDEPF